MTSEKQQYRTLCPYPPVYWCVSFILFCVDCDGDTGTGATGESLIVLHSQGQRSMIFLPPSLTPSPSLPLPPSILLFTIATLPTPPTSTEAPTETEAPGYTQSYSHRA